MAPSRLLREPFELFLSPVLSPSGEGAKESPESGSRPAGSLTAGEKREAPEIIFLTLSPPD